MSSLVEKICVCLETLINGRKSDSPNKCNPKDKKEALFFELKKNVHFAFEVIEKYDDLKTLVKQYILICHKKKCKTCDYLNFLELSVVLLKLLGGALLAEETEQTSTQTKKASVPKGLLSISQQKIVKKSLQFIVALGILPNLLRGIGIPLSKRLEYAKMLEHFAPDISPRQKQAQIAVCLETLLSCMERPALQAIIVSNHETDLLAALFQLCHAPIKKIEPKTSSANETCKTDSTTQISHALPLSASPKNADRIVNKKNFAEKYFTMKLSTIKDYSSYSDHQLINEMVDDRNYFTPKLERFLKQICPSLLLWELLLFQGIPIKSEESDFTISKVPVWLKKICSQMLTDMILQSHGIASFVQVVLDKAYDVDVKSGKVDTVRLDAVARLIAYNPVRHISVEDYIHRLSRQVLDLLRLEGSQMDTILHYVASSIILHICDRDMKSAEKYFLDTLFQPLWMCVSTTGEAKIVVEEKVLSYCVLDIHKIFILNNSPLSRKHIKLLFPFFHCFSNMYFFLLEGISSLKSKVKNLLLNILSSANDDEAMSLLHAATFSTIDDKDILVYMTTVDFAYGEEGGIGAVRHVEDDYSDLDINCRAILGLLSELKNKNLNRSFILLVLKVFCSYRNEVLKDPGDPKYERFRNLFLAFIQELIQQDFDVREALMSNVSEVIEILVILLETVLKWEDDDYDKTIMIVLIILNILMFGNDELSPSEWAVLNKCLPSLEKLMKKPINSCLKDMVSCIITYMATHGVAGGSNSYEEIMRTCISKLYEHTNETLKSEESIGESSESAETDCSHRTTQGESSSTNTSFMNIPLDGIPFPESSDKTSSLASDLEEMLKLNRDLNKKIDEFTSFEKAIQDIKDTSIPIKGHGLIAVGKLLSSRDKETLCYKKELLSIFQEGLENEDSYVYLSAIQCLSLLADIDAELVLPTILKIYQNPGDKNCEFILKAGEVLLKICRSLGEFAYKYKDQLLHTYLIGAKHEDARIRSSSLSNLGEACMHLKFNLSGHWLQEILMCVQSLLKTDRDLEVRRCAVMVITLLLRGLGRDIFQILENEIKDIYSHLKIVYATESDEVLRLHSQLALEEINTIMKELLTAQLPLTKEIRILHH